VQDTHEKGSGLVLDELRIWIISLITISVICAVVEKFAPEGGLNKYVKLVCGLAVAVVIAGPVLSFLGRDFSIKETAWNDYMSVSKAELESRIRRLEEEEAGRMLEVYRQSLISDVKSRYMGETDFMVTEADLVLQEDANSSDFGTIRKLYIKVGPRPGNERASFGIQTEERIKDELSQLLGIDRERIIVDSGNFEGG